MVKTVDQLMKENARLKSNLEEKRKLRDLENERIMLGKQNKKLLSELSRSPTNREARRVIGVVGKEVWKKGKTFGKNLAAYGRYLNEQENVNRRKTKTLKKTLKVRPKRKLTRSNSRKRGKR